MMRHAILGLVAALSATAPAHAQQHARPAEEVTMAVPAVGFPFVAGYVADRLKLWEKHGLRVKTIVIAGIGSTNAVISGSAVFAVHRGTGNAQIGDRTFAIAPHDVFVAPPWLPYSFTADSELELFSYSDRAGQEALGYWREQIG